MQVAPLGTSEVGADGVSYMWQPPLCDGASKEEAHV